MTRLSIHTDTLEVREAMKTSSLILILAVDAILTYHVFSGDVRAAQVVNLDQALTVEGSSLPIQADDSGVQVGNAKVLATDVDCSNGVIHVIDNVLIPAS